MKRFQARPGEVEININAASPVAVEEAIATRRANVGLTIVRSDLPGLVYKPIGEETTSLYCGVEHPLAIRRPGGDVTEQDLERADFVTRGYLRSRATLPGKQRLSTATAHHVEGAVQLILSGHYIGVLPDHIAKPWVDMGKMVRLQIPRATASTPLCIVVREQSLNIPAISALVEDLASSYSVGR